MNVTEIVNEILLWRQIFGSFPIKNIIQMILATIFRTYQNFIRSEKSSVFANKHQKGWKIRRAIRRHCLCLQTQTYHNAIRKNLNNRFLTWWTFQRILAQVRTCFVDKSKEVQKGIASTSLLQIFFTDQWLIAKVVFMHCVV